MSTVAYSEYKESGVAWIGLIPEKWGISRVRELVDLINGYPFDAAQFTENVGLPLVRIRDLNAKEAAVCFGGEVIDAALITEADLLIGMDGDFNVGRWRGEGPALLNQRVCCLRGEKPVLRLLEHALPTALQQINDVTYSTTVKHLSSRQVYDIRVALPSSKAELANLVGFLDRETGKIDALVDEQRRLITLLKEKRQAVISHAVTKGLDPNAPMKDPGVEWLGEVPAHWTVAPLKYIARVQTGVAKGKDMQGKDSALVPYLRVANVQDGYLDLSDVAEIEMPLADIDRYLLQVGDVLMNEGGDFDKLGRGDIWRGQVVPCIHQNHVFAVRPTGVSPEWLNTFTGSSFAQFYFMGRSKQSTNLASISSRNVMDLPVVVPPSDEQLAVAQAVKSQVERLLGLIDQAETAIALLAERRAALISAAVTGKIDMRSLVTATTAQEAA